MATPHHHRIVILQAKAGDATTATTPEDIERVTRGQASNPAWHKARYGRVTASKVGPILASYRSGDQKSDAKIRAKQNLARPIMTGVTFGPTEAMEYGSAHEADGIEAYASGMDDDKARLIVGLGLHVHPGHHWLGSSPDGVYVCGEDKRLVEVKCAFSRKDDPRPNFDDDPKFYIHKVGDKHQLNLRTSQGRAYYYQIQTTLAVMGLSVCDLVVWTPARMEVVRVARQSEEDEKEMIQTLYKFWYEYVERHVESDYWHSREEEGGPKKRRVSE
jgi:hypothetical protein